MPDGGCIVAADAQPQPNSAEKPWLLRLDASGDTVWTRFANAGLGGEAYSIELTHNGDVVAAGTVGYHQPIMCQAWLAKFTANGDSVWSREFGGPGDQIIYKVRETPDGGFILAGLGCFDGNYLPDFYVIRTDSLGDSLWTCHYGGNARDQAWSVDVTHDGGFIVAGGTDSFGQGGEVWLLRLNPDGSVLWAQTLAPSPGLDEADDVRETPDHGFILVGQYEAAEFLAIKTDSAGTVEWQRNYLPFSDNHDIARSVLLMPDGGYLLAGATTGNAANEGGLIRITSQGDVVWRSAYRAPGDNVQSAFWGCDLMPNGQVYLSGYGNCDASGGTDLWIMKLDAEDLSAAQPRFVNTAQSSLESFPNPFNSTTTLAFSLPRAEEVVVSVYDVLGRQVETLAKETRGMGKQRLVFDGSPLSTGTYFITLSSHDVNISRKVMLLK